MRNSAFPLKARKISYCYQILMIKERKLNLEVTLQGAVNRIEFGCVLPELFVIKHALVKTLRTLKML